MLWQLEWRDESGWTEDEGVFTCVTIDPIDFFTSTLADFVEEVLGNEWDVLVPFTKWRQLDWYDTDTIIEIFAERDFQQGIRSFYQRVDMDVVLVANDVETSARMGLTLYYTRLITYAIAALSAPPFAGLSVPIFVSRKNLAGSDKTIQEFDIGVYIDEE